MTKRLTDAELREAIATYAGAGGNEVAAAHAAKMSRSAFQNRLRRARERFPDLVPAFPATRGGHPKNPERSLTDDVTLHRAQESGRAAQARLKEAQKVITQLEDRIKDLEWGAKGAFTPVSWTLPTVKPKKREHTPYLLTSDFQVGEVIRAEETEAGYGYDVETFRRRYRQMISTTIYLSTEHVGKDWTFPGIIYARGGDAISGGIHDELRETDEMTPIEACEVVFEEEAAGIAKLADAFGRVEVKSPDAAGNHDRDTMKPRAKKASAHSYDRLTSFMLRTHFARDKRITFQTSRSFDVFFPIYDRNILLTHGDRIGSRGGMGFIGPAAVIMRGAQKVIAEQAALGRIVHRVDMGHHHYPMPLDWVVCNGCMPGYSEYAKSFRMRPTPPLQYLFYHHPKRGVVDYKPIYLGA